MQTKSIFLSKTFWFNIVTIIVALATFFGYTPNQVIANNLTAFLLAFGPIINIALRSVTTKAVTL